MKTKYSLIESKDKLNPTSFILKATPSNLEEITGFFDIILHHPIPKGFAYTIVKSRRHEEEEKIPLTIIFNHLGLGFIPTGSIDYSAHQLSEKEALEKAITRTEHYMTNELIDLMKIYDKTLAKLKVSQEYLKV